MKKKKIIIIAIILLITVAGIYIGINIYNNSINKQQNISNEHEYDNFKPAENDNKLIETTSLLSNVEVSNTDIKFYNDLNVDVGSKIALWLYSNPKFIGWFEVKEKDQIKYIDGISKALQQIEIEQGNHHMAFVSESNKTIGYTNIEIDDNNNIIEKDAIKELGIAPDYYTEITMYSQAHFHLNSNYTFYVDDEGVKDNWLLDSTPEMYLLANEIDFNYGTFSLIEQNNDYIKLNFTFHYNNGTEENVEGYIYNTNYVEPVQQLEMYSKSKIKLIVAYDKLYLINTNYPAMWKYVSIQ